MIKKCSACDGFGRIDVAGDCQPCGRCKRTGVEPEPGSFAFVPADDVARHFEQGRAAAIKNDREKTQLELLSPIWVNGVGQVLTFGAKKYAAHNWRKGLQISRLLGACLRHVFAFLGGQDLDPETGLCHLDHASCCLMFARELWETRKDLDDRYRPDESGAK